MSTIHLDHTTTLTPEQCIAGLTDFGQGRSGIFSNSADDYLKVHQLGSTEATSRTALEASGSAFTTTDPTPTVLFVNLLIGLPTFNGFRQRVLVACG